MAKKGKDEEDTSSWRPVGRQLRPDGRLTGDLPVAAAPAKGPAPAPPGKPSALPTLDALTTGELVLQTEKPAPRPVYVEPPAYRPIVVPSRSGPVKWVLLLLALGALALAAFVLFPDLERMLPAVGGAKGALTIFSEPSGALVKIAGTVVGETPWAGDNVWTGEVKYEISAGGYKPNRGTFQGGKAVRLNVKLVRK